MATLLSSTDPGRATFPFSALGLISNASARLAVAADNANTAAFFGLAEAGAEVDASADEKRLAAGKRVDAGRWGKGKRGIGGIDERVFSRD
jgi:hypothetical protein